MVLLHWVLGPNDPNTQQYVRVCDTRASCSSLTLHTDRLYMY